MKRKARLKKTKKRLKAPVQKLQQLSELSTEDISRCNEIIHGAFSHSPEVSTSNYMGGFSLDTLVSMVMKDNTIAGVALAEPRVIHNVDTSLMSPIQICVHSIAIDPLYQGLHLCSYLVECLVKGIKKTYKDVEQHGEYPVYLNVRVSDTNPNMGAVRCYENQGFRLLDIPLIQKQDGQNAYMKLFSKMPAKRTKKRHKKN